MTFKFESFDVWKRAIEFADEMFNVADNLPQKYQFSLGEQLHRAALSIPTNLAEGSGRDNPKEKNYFYRLSKGSVYEVVSLLVMIGNCPDSCTAFQSKQKAANLLGSAASCNASSKADTQTGNLHATFTLYSARP